MILSWPIMDSLALFCGQFVIFFYLCLSLLCHRLQFLSDNFTSASIRMHIDIHREHFELTWKWMRSACVINSIDEKSAHQGVVSLRLVDFGRRPLNVYETWVQLPPQRRHEFILHQYENILCAPMNFTFTTLFSLKCTSRVSAHTQICSHRPQWRRQTPATTTQNHSKIQFCCGWSNTSDTCKPGCHSIRSIASTLCCPIVNGSRASACKLTIFELSKIARLPRATHQVSSIVNFYYLFAMHKRSNIILPLFGSNGLAAAQRDRSTFLQ